MNNIADSRLSPKLALTLSPLALALASCSYAQTGDSGVEPGVSDPFAITEHGAYNEPWAAAFAPGTEVLFLTEKSGAVKFYDVASGERGEVRGVPEVDYGGQGGLGDIAFLPSEAGEVLGPRTIYLSWAEAGENDTRGAAVGRGTLVCEETAACTIEGLEVIWRQNPKVTGRGHYSHRFAFAPDGKYLFIASGDRQKMQPAQDPNSDLGKVIRIPIDASGKPTGPAERYSLGHRNILGLQFDGEGRLWDLEHGPKGGDELNLVQQGKNYGWPVVSDGDHYSGENIPDHATRPEFAAAAIGWTPVIAPGDFTFITGKLFGDWKGDAIIAGLDAEALVRVSFEGTAATEAARYPFGKRLREVLEGPDGALYVLEDGEGGRLLRLAPKK
ncbi:PQQ-dependent sugar dehydrogenase [Parerythrobacter lacustris]|uniref:PQQ-dependent sugar dehydrogenase n=1 Tax=Parerythrobacter lacustris TaxID=2969984 RepID=A0ABT1XTJ2_9SPHN|nr:PQQ-dependent sugar dehydrogenase [Parerythrobacter lacustris]MCR2835001.1 PQQ-dependent sugar dehydrogenase [Parerythrobacter lacustris]